MLFFGQSQNFFARCQNFFARDSTKQGVLDVSLSHSIYRVKNAQAGGSADQSAGDRPPV
jgi:hypothetical protein